MFDFDDETGSEARYTAAHAATANEPEARIKHRGWWLVHNLIAHPLIGLAPGPMTFDFHDWTSRRMNAIADRAIDEAVIERSVGR